ncbi:Cytochrome P450 [Elaphomyces granulatus]
MVGSKAHSARKRMLSNIYSKSFLQSSDTLKIISHTMIYDRLLPVLFEAASSGSLIDIYDLNQAFTMDFISAFIFGLANATNFLQDVPTRKFMLQKYHCRKDFEFYYQEVPNLLAWTEALGIPLLPKWYHEANELMAAWNLALCENAEKHLGSNEPDLEPTVYKQLKLSMAKQLASGSDGSSVKADEIKLQRLEIACEMYDQLTAGHETSAVGLTYLCWELSKRPHLQAALRKELQTLSPAVTYPITSHSLHSLPHPKLIDALPLLQAVVMETLRLHAPIPGIQPRTTPYPTSSLAGYDRIPPNTRVNAQAYSLHRNPEVFPDPESWQPHRWLKEDDSAELEEMQRWFWAFGSGRRRKRSEKKLMHEESVEMKLVVAAIYTNFLTTIVDDEGIEATDAYTVKPSGHKLILKFEPI